MSTMVGDRVVWRGDAAIRPIGSNGTIRHQKGLSVLVDWGDGDESSHTHGMDVVRVQTAARLGIQPWATVATTEDREG
jgi:hypothetical protein